MIKSISLKNLLSFGDPGVTLELKPLNVLIGANGSGKSNLIDAISLLQAAPRDIAEPVRRGGGIRAWIHNAASSNSNAAELSVRVQSPGSSSDALRYELKFGGETRFAIERESIGDPAGDDSTFHDVFVFEGGRAFIQKTTAPDDPYEWLVDDYDEGRSVVAQLEGDPRLREARRLARDFESIRIYRDWTFGRQAVLRVPQRADEKNDHLADNASNLGLVLSRFRNNTQAKKKLLAELANFMDGVRDFNVYVEGGTVQLFLEEYDRTIPATRLSDGTLRYLALLAILCDPAPPPLLCIEEPELGLHPDILPDVAKLLVETSERAQLIVTTHSEILVNALTETPESIVVCERDERGSRLSRLDVDKLGPWLEDYRLGQLWSKGDIGGNRW